MKKFVGGFVSGVALCAVAYAAWTVYRDDKYFGQDDVDEYDYDDDYDSFVDDDDDEDDDAQDE